MSNPWKETRVRVPSLRKQSGRTPDIHRKAGPHRDRSKYNRKPKHKGETP